MTLFDAVLGPSGRRLQSAIGIDLSSNYITCCETCVIKRLAGSETQVISGLVIISIYSLGGRTTVGINAFLEDSPRQERKPVLICEGLLQLYIPEQTPVNYGLWVFTLPQVSVCGWVWPPELPSVSHSPSIENVCWRPVWHFLNASVN